jgi:hypothetical protein
MTGGESAIPILDVRDGGLEAYAEQCRARALSLRDSCLASFPHALVPFIPALDRAARHWLARSCSPYVPEIARIAETLGFPGTWLLNCSYQWGCTALARDEDGAPWLARTLDWPFAGLGRNADVIRAQGLAGDYFSVTWPGYCGVLTAMAPSRFAACVNQAPMRRRTSHPWLRLYDMAANGFNTWANIRHIPPDQLLRAVFETCETYSDARSKLENTPVARPVIYTLAGCEAGERCVIERTETGFVTRENDTSAANDFVPARPMWEARMAANYFLTLPSAEAAARCAARRGALAGWGGELSRGHFGWVMPPVLNPYTRLAVAMCPARGILRAAGYEMTGADLPKQVTDECELHAAAGKVQ